MFAKCKDLAPVLDKHTCVLRGGKEGLNRIVTWPYVLVHPELDQCLRGGEFLFISNLPPADFGEDPLIHYFNIAVMCEASAVAVMCGSEHIPEMPGELVKLADERNMPLYEISWDDWLVDITYELGELLVQYNNRDMEKKSILLDLIYGQIYNREEFLKRASAVNHNYTKCHTAAVAEIYNKKKQDKGQYEFRIVSDTITSEFTDTIFLQMGNRVVLFIPDGGIQAVERLESKFEHIIKKVTAKYPGCVINVGIGSKVTELDKYSKSYQQASKTVDNLNKENMENVVAHYRDMGLYQLISMGGNVDDIMEYCTEIIGPLENYDEAKGADLINTYEVYFNSKFNLAKTAQDLYLHRNTLLYRLGKIEELLNVKLSEPKVCLDIMNSIMLYQFLFHKKKR